MHEVLDPIDETGDRWEWYEVTEVFESANVARAVEDYTRGVLKGDIRSSTESWIGEYIESKPIAAPRQARMAERVIGQIERKLAKRSYNGLVEKWGPGDLIVGLPLWGSVSPVDRRGRWVSVKSFGDRLKAGLLDIRDRGALEKVGAFKMVTVVWAPNRDEVARLLGTRIRRRSDLPMPEDMLDGVSVESWPNAMHMSIYVRGRVPSKEPATTRRNSSVGLKQRLKEMTNRIGWKQDSQTAVEIDLGRLRIKKWTAVVLMVKACCEYWHKRKHGWWRKTARESRRRGRWSYAPVKVPDLLV